MVAKRDVVAAMSKLAINAQQKNLLLAVGLWPSWDTDVGAPPSSKRPRVTRVAADEVSHCGQDTELATALVGLAPESSSIAQQSALASIVAVGDHDDDDALASSFLEGR